MKMQIQNLNDLLQGEMFSKEVIDKIFNDLDKKLLDKKEIVLDFKKITFISVYFLEALENFVLRAKDLRIKVEIKNVKPNIYKVFQVGRAREILECCFSTC